MKAFCLLFMILATTTISGCIRTKTASTSSLSISTPETQSFVNLSNAAHLSISGSCSGMEKVYLSISDGTHTLTPGLDVVCKTGSIPNWSTTLDVSSLSDGTLLLRVAKNAGFGSGTLSLDLNKDVVAPDAPTISLPASAPPVSSSLTPTFEVTGADVGSKISIFTDSSCSSSSLSASKVAAAQTESLTPASLSADGVYRFYVNQVDPAGNPSPCSESYAEYTLDSMGHTPTLVRQSPLLSPGANPNVSFSISGVESGSTVFLYQNASCTGSAESTQTASDSSIDVTGQALTSDGTYFYSTRYSNGTGDFSNCSNAVTYVLDRNVMTPLLQLTSPSASPGNLATPSVTASNIESGSTVNLYRDANCTTLETSRVVSTASSIFNLNLSSDGTYVYSVQQTDPAGNISQCSSSATYVLDRAVANPVLVLTSPTSPGTVTSPTLTVNSAETGATVSLFKNAACTGAAVTSLVASNSSVTFNPSLTTDGTFLFYAKQVDVAGNQSACSPSVSYILDRAVSTPSLALSSPSSSPSSQTSPTFIASSLEIGSTVKLYKNSSCTAPAEMTGSATSSTFSFHLSALTTDGSYSFSVQQTDSAGNVSPCSTAVAYQLDRTVSTPTLVLTAPSSTPSNEVNLTVTAANLEAGSTVKLYRTEDCSGTSESSKTAASTSVTFNAMTLTLDGDYFYSVRQTDTAGNVSSCSASVAYTLDRNAPVPILALTSPALNLSPTVSPVIAVNGVKTNAIVSLYKNAACTGTAEASKVASSTSTSFTIAALSPDGLYQFYASYLDEAGNPSGCSTALNYTLDRVVATPTLALTPPSSSPANQTSLTLTASSIETGSTVKIYPSASCGGTELSSQVASGTSVNFTITSFTTDGDYSFSVKQIDAAGNVSTCSNTLVYTLDRVATTPTLVLTAPSSTPSKLTTPTLTVGGVETGSSVKIFMDQDCTGTPVATQTASSTSAAITLSAITSDGDHSFYAMYTDVAKNDSNCTSSVSYTLDTQTTTPTLAMSNPTTNAGSLTTPTVLVNLVENGSTVRVYKTADCTGGAFATQVASGTSKSITLGALGTDATYNLSSNYTDLAGNNSLCSNALAYTLDTVAPTVGTALTFSSQGATSITASWGAATDTNPVQYKLIQALSKADIDLVGSSNSYNTNVSGVTEVTGWTTSRSVASSSLSDGTTYYYAVLVKDSAGNTSRYSNGVSYTIPGMNNSGTYTLPQLYFDAAFPLGNYGVTCNSGLLSAATPNWKDLSGQTNNGIIPASFTCTSTAGWKGDGSAADPYRIVFEATGAHHIETLFDASPSAMAATTWEIWLKPKLFPFGSNQQIMSTDDGGFDRSLIIPFNTSVYNVFAGTPGTIYSGFAVTSGWQHLVLIYSGSTAVLYKNGVAGTTITTLPSSQGTLHKLWIGNNPGAYEVLGGEVGYVAVFNVALSATDIQRHCLNQKARFASTLTCN